MNKTCSIINSPILFESIQTHKNIVNRFSKAEQSKSARVLVMSSVAFFLQILPFIVLSFVAYFDAASRDLYLLIGLLGSVFNIHAKLDFKVW